MATITTSVQQLWMSQLVQNQERIKEREQYQRQKGLKRRREILFIDDMVYIKKDYKVLEIKGESNEVVGYEININVS